MAQTKLFLIQKRASSSTATGFPSFQVAKLRLLWLIEAASTLRFRVLNMMMPITGDRERSPPPKDGGRLKRTRRLERFGTTLKLIVLPCCKDLTCS
ncbi:hypothetical protein PIB30_040181 [Stylosanthes scabra]|uniref:Uncharacterized protein n=1 Tax=Stylosanthes scabra TaxID=79078 RepID=A0ABU6YDE6_9FABA|nr:hypothetical protein [Stylosanthes scabra]